MLYHPNHIHALLALIAQIGAAGTPTPDDLTQLQALARTAESDRLELHIGLFEDKKEGASAYSFLLPFGAAFDEDAFVTWLNNGPLIEDNEFASVWQTNPEILDDKSTPQELARAYYLVHNVGDIEPHVVDRFPDFDATLAAARTIRREEGDEDGLFCLTVDSLGVPEINAFTGGEMEGDDD